MLPSPVVVVLGSYKAWCVYAREVDFTTLNWIFSYVKGYSNRGWLTMIFTVRIQFFLIHPFSSSLFIVVHSFHRVSVNSNSSFLFHYILSVIIPSILCIWKQCQLVSLSLVIILLLLLFFISFFALLQYYFI